MYHAVPGRCTEVSVGSDRENRNLQNYNFQFRKISVWMCVGVVVYGCVSSHKIR